MGTREVETRAHRAPVATLVLLLLFVCGASACDMCKKNGEQLVTAEGVGSADVAANTTAVDMGILSTVRCSVPKGACTGRAVHDAVQKVAVRATGALGAVSGVESVVVKEQIVEPLVSYNATTRKTTFTGYSSTVRLTAVVTSSAVGDAMDAALAAGVNTFYSAKLHITERQRTAAERSALGRAKAQAMARARDVLDPKSQPDLEVRHVEVLSSDGHDGGAHGADHCDHFGGWPVEGTVSMSCHVRLTMAVGQNNTNSSEEAKGCSHGSGNHTDHGSDSSTGHAGDGSNNCSCKGKAEAASEDEGHDSHGSGANKTSHDKEHGSDGSGGCSCKGSSGCACKGAEDAKGEGAGHGSHDSSTNSTSHGSDSSSDNHDEHGSHGSSTNSTSHGSDSSSDDHEDHGSDDSAGHGSTGCSCKGSSGCKCKGSGDDAAEASDNASDEHAGHEH